MDDESLHAHEWVVFSTALADRCLMIQCVDCGVMGTVDDPTSEEWSAAFYALSKPYQWNDEARVIIQHGPPCPFHVVRADKNAPRCDCPSHQEQQEYERFPAEFMMPNNGLTPVEMKEIKKLADMVGKTDLCSRFFPLFMRAYQATTGSKSSDAE